MITDLYKFAEDDIKNGEFKKAMEKLEEALALLIKHKTEYSVEVIFFFKYIFLFYIIIFLGCRYVF